MPADNSGSPACIGKETTPSPADVAFEFMLNALRLSSGFAVRTMK
jgi:hypothetical protein